MLRSRPVWPLRSMLMGALPFFLAASPLSAQDAAPADGDMTFPRQAFSWFWAGQADELWARAAAPLREMMESPQGIREAAAEFPEMMGTETAVLSEQLLTHDGARVYLRATAYTLVPELFWAVTFTPEDRMVHSILALPRQVVVQLYPEARLP
jgi:hypothetical protein